MPLPRVAIVGRPNVGKSSLMNLLAREKVSIVDDLPGVTRDRVSTIVHLEDPEGEGPGVDIEVIDTGGFGVYVAEGQQIDDAGKDLTQLTEQIEWQIAQGGTSNYGDNFILVSDLRIETVEDDAPPVEIDSISRDPAGNIRISWLPTAGYSYKVEYSDDLVNWRADLPDSDFPSPAETGPLVFVDANLPQTGSRYYRLLQTSGD